MVYNFWEDACEETKNTIIGVHSIDNEQNVASQAKGIKITFIRVVKLQKTRKKKKIFEYILA